MANQISSVYIKNQDWIVDTYLAGLVASEGWTNITELIVIITRDTINVYDKISNIDPLIPLMEFEVQDKRAAGSYLCNCRFWDRAPQQYVESINTDDEFIPEFALDVNLINSFAIYNTDPTDYNTLKYVYNPIASIEAQAETAVLITPQVFKRLQDPFNSTKSVMTMSDFQAIYPSRQSARAVSLAAWKLANGWVG